MQYQLDQLAVFQAVLLKGEENAPEHHKSATNPEPVRPSNRYTYRWFHLLRALHFLANGWGESQKKRPEAISTQMCSNVQAPVLLLFLISFSIPRS